MIINIDQIGPVSFIKSKRAKNLNIKLQPFKDVRVSVPTNMGYGEAEWIVEGKIDWIKQHQINIKNIESKQIVFDENSNYKTRFHSLHLVQTEKETIKIRVADNKINVSYPKNISVREEIVQIAIKKGIDAALKKEALLYLPDRVNYFSSNLSLPYNQVRLKNIRSRWGSCSIRNNINLSIHLMRIPNHLIDYVIIHELVHTIHKNHGAKFWDLLNSITGNAKALDKELKNFKIAFY